MLASALYLHNDITEALCDDMEKVFSQCAYFERKDENMGAEKKRAYRDGTFKTSQIADMVDIEYVAETLGIEMQRRGGKVSILCPSHNDKHFGSCYLHGNNSWKCYACNAGGDSIKLVQIVQNTSFRQACAYICDLYGSEEEFKDDAANATPHKKLIGDDMLQRIGIPKQVGARVRTTIASFWSEAEGLDYIDELPPEEGRLCTLEWSPLTEENAAYYAQEAGVPKRQIPTGLYLVQKTVLVNPLQDLRDHDEDAYHALAARKAKEAAEKLRTLAVMPLNPAAYYDPNEPSSIREFIMADRSAECASYVGFNFWSAELNKMAKTCEDLAIEHSFEKTNPEENTPKPRKRIAFGKIRTGASL